VCKYKSGLALRLSLMMSFLFFWWFFWLLLSHFELTGLRKPSFYVYFQFYLLLLFFILGGFFSYIKHIALLQYNTFFNEFVKEKKSRFPLAFFILISVFVFLFWSLFRSGFFEMSYGEYYFYVRRYNFSDYLTGAKYADIFLKIFVFPLVITMLAIGFSGNLTRLNFIIALLCLVMYSILWQVNYPVIYFFWFLVIHVIFLNQQPFSGKLKSYMLLFFLILILLVSAGNRYGGLAWGAVERYFINYHLIGFSLYDNFYTDPDHILHKLSYGRSSLGFFDQFFDLFLRSFGFDIQAASFQNANENMSPLNIGKGDSFYSNAFGTIIFSFYRDFNILGIALGGFFYAYFLVKYYIMSPFSWRARSVYLILATAWVTGMMVSPVEQPYFWFSIFVIMFLTRIKVSSKKINV